MQKTLIDDDGEVRALTDDSNLRAVMLRDVLPNLAAHSQKRKVGRPKVAAPKRTKSFKLSPDLIDAIVALGKGYNKRVEAVLRESIAEGRI